MTKSDYTTNPFITVDGSYTNDRGKEFIVYRDKNTPRRVFVTGADLDWEAGYEYDGARRLEKAIALTQEEADGLSQALEFGIDVPEASPVAAEDETEDTRPVWSRK